MKRRGIIIADMDGNSVRLNLRATDAEFAALVEMITYRSSGSCRETCLQIAQENRCGA